VTKPSTIVLLDDSESWLEFVGNVIGQYPESRRLRIQAFPSDAAATAYVQANAPDILGYVQDLHRHTSQSDRVVDGVNFLNDVIARETPSARAVILSGFIDVGVLRRVYQTSTYEVQFVDKASFTAAAFRSPFLWLIADRPPSSEIARQLLEPHIEILQLPWDDIRNHLARHPEHLHTMNPRVFEGLVGEFMRSYGWDVEYTAQTRDGGYDIIAIRHHSPSSLRVLVEAKRFAPDCPVGVGIVRSVYGVRALRHASQVIIATSSYVSEDAKREFIHVVPWELDFVEREQILSWCMRSKAVTIE
jgi:restriction system protein